VIIGTRMRIPTKTTMLVVAALAAQGTLVYSHATARAEEFGGPCTFLLPGAILPLPVYFNTTTGSPFTPPKAEFTDPEPVSDFSATANWGDGTTTPASISSGSGLCHEVTAPSHAYAHSGAYPFSYTVHDAHTGLDHTIGAETVYIWGLPQRVDAPSSRTIKATVGVPWSGVLGEFTEESVPFTGAQYYVRIEWEAGDRQWAPGTVTAGENGRLVVAGSHVYPATFNGTATVIVGITEATSTWPVSVSAEEPVPFAFRGPPILAAIPSVRGSTAYELIFRLDRSLPRAPSGRIEASLSGYGVAGSLAGFGLHKSRACYAAGITIPKRRAPRTHRHYPITLSAQEPGVPKTHGHAMLRRYSNFVGMLTGAAKKLGC
jgi:hypothetical protein